MINRYINIIVSGSTTYKEKLRQVKGIKIGGELFGMMKMDSDDGRIL